METPSQKKAKEKTESTQLEKQVAELRAQVNANEAQKQADLEEAAQAVEEKKQSDLLKQEAELKAASDLTKLLDGVEKEASENVDKKRTVEDLSNAQLIDVMTTSIDKALNARDELTRGAIKKEVVSVKESVDGIKKVLQQQHAQSSVAAARAKHKDFDDHKEGILAVMNKYPGIEPEDAYNLAVAVSAKKVPDKKNTETEKPSGNPTGGPEHKTERERYEHDPEIGLTGFRDLVSDGFDKAIANMDRPD